MSEVADLLFLLFVKTHDQRNGRGFKACNALRIDVLDPARREILRQRLFGGHAHHVKAERLAAAALDAEDGLRGVVVL